VVLLLPWDGGPPVAAVTREEPAFDPHDAGPGRSSSIPPDR
jgi:hypothetical protein